MPLYLPLSSLSCSQGTGAEELVHASSNGALVAGQPPRTSPGDSARPPEVDAHKLEIGQERIFRQDPVAREALYRKEDFLIKMTHALHAYGLPTQQLETQMAHVAKAIGVEGAPILKRKRVEFTFGPVSSNVRPA